mgnify:FL=1
MGQRIGKKFKRLLLTGLLMIALLTACAGKGGEGSIEQSETDYKGITVGNAASTGTDVVILMDESGSMVKADTDRIAIEGAKLFVDMEKLDNAKIGLVEFSNVIKSTGLLDMSEQSGRESIKAVMNGISYSGKAHTDTGAGLLEAISLLEQSGSYEKRSIILFTDGRTDIDAGTKGRTTEDSLADVDRAIQTAQEKGYTIYCIGLNDNNSVDLEQLAKIATETGGQYLVTTDVSSITDFFERIFADIGNSDISSLDEYVADGEYHEVRFKIDNANVMEANIVILSSKEVEDVTLQNPSGETVDLKSDEKVVFTKSDKYTIVKLILPQTGEWCVNVKGVDGDAIKIGRIFNYDLKLVVEADRTELTTEGEVNLKAYLATVDTPLQDSAFYQTMTGYVQITDQTEESWEEPLEWDETEKCMMKSGLKFEVSGNYNMRVHLEGNGFYRDSEDIPVYVSKNAPVIVKSLSEIKLHQDKTKEVDLSEYFEDKEGSAITYGVDTDSDEVKAEIEGSVLRLTAEKPMEGKLYIYADNGAVENTGVQVKLVCEAPGKWLKVLVVLAAAVAVLIGLLVMLRKRGIMLSGNFKLSVEESRENSAGTNDIRYYNIPMTIPVSSFCKHSRYMFTINDLLEILPQYYDVLDKDEKDAFLACIQDIPSNESKKVKIQGSKQSYELYVINNSSEVKLLENQVESSKKTLQVRLANEVNGMPMAMAREKKFAIRFTRDGKNYVQINVGYQMI